MNLTRKLYLVALCSLAATALCQAQVTNYDTVDTAAIAGYSESNANNPIFGDAITLSSGGGTLDFIAFTLFNSSSGGNTGSITKGLMNVFIYDNTIPYDGTTPINNPVVWSGQLQWDFTSGGGLPAGFYTIGYWTFGAAGPVLPQNILITQQFGLTQGTSTRNGIVLFQDSPMGSSPNYVYLNSSATPEGFYSFNGSAANSQIGYMISSLGGGGGTNHQPVADSQSVTLLRDTPTPVTLTGSDADGDPLTYNVATTPTHGSLSGTAPNLTYTPNLAYVGSDSFTFTVNDGQTDSVPATVSLTINPPPNGLVIIPVWDSTILNDPNVVSITNTINNAIQVYETKYRDPITVTIKFQEMGSGLGQSSTFFGTTPYQTFYNALVADSKTTNDTVALPNVPGGTVNPVDGSGTMALTTANFRALGMNVSPGGGQPDSTIGLNMSIINITRPPVNPNNYDLQAVVSHEIDEALGSSSGLGQGNTRPADLFRYSSPGVRNFTTAGDSAFFSITAGATMLAQYNQNASGDYGDWWSLGAHVPRVQDAFATPGAIPNLGVELTVLDAIGYDLAPPAPPAVFQSVNVSGGQINFIWSATYGRSYQVQSTTSLSPAGWVNTGSPVIASGPTASYSESVSGPQKFYRVALLPQPAPAPAMGPADKILTGPLQIDTRYLLPAPGMGQTSQAGPTQRLPEPAKLWPFKPTITIVK